jgi:lipoteichoic acid synthase
MAVMRSKSSFFEIALYVLIFLLFLLYLFIVAYSPLKPKGFYWGFSSLVLPAYELAFVGLLTLSVWRLRSTWLRYIAVPIAMILPMLIGSVYLVQLGSIMLSGSYLTVLALENLSEIAFAITPKTLALGLGMACLLAIPAFAAVADLCRGVPKRGGAAMVFAAAVLMGALYDARKDIVTFSIDTQFSPTLNLKSTLSGFIVDQNDLDLERERVARFAGAVSNGNITMPYTFDVKAEFPFQRRGIASNPLPFTVGGLTGKPLNVIILFFEGVSARVMGHYGGPYANLTPVLDRFSERTITVDNYYNHTAATFRGIRGGAFVSFSLFRRVRQREKG